MYELVKKTSEKKGIPPSPQVSRNSVNNVRSETKILSQTHTNYIGRPSAKRDYIFIGVPYHSQPHRVYSKRPPFWGVVCPVRFWIPVKNVMSGFRSISLIGTLLQHTGMSIVQRNGQTCANNIHYPSDSCCSMGMAPIHDDVTGNP
jgi:hypothetical protein